MTRMATLTVLLFWLLSHLAGASAISSEADVTVRLDSVASQRVYIGTNRGELVALSAGDGTALWHVPTAYPFAVIRLEAESITIGTSSPIRPGSTTLEPKTQLLAIASTTGVRLWSSIWPAELAVIGATSELLLIRGVMSPCAGLADDPVSPWPGVTALELATGRVVWTGALAYDARLEHLPEPVLYLVEPDADLMTFDVAARYVDSGGERWLAPIDAPVALRIIRVDADRLYVATGQVETMLSGTEGWLAALDRWTGEPRWGTRTGPLGLAGNTLTPAGGGLAVATSDRARAHSTVRLLAPESGATIWSTELAGFVHHGLDVTGAWLVAGVSPAPDQPGAGAMIVALSPGDGTIAWTRMTLTPWAGAIPLDDTSLVIVTRDATRDSQSITSIDTRTLRDRWVLHGLTCGDVEVDAEHRLYITTGRETTAVSDLRVYAGGYALTAVHSITGELAWVFAP